jgi:dolichol-phosphate mannosyltransferase
VETKDDPLRSAITIVVLARNEEGTIAEVVESARPFGQEVLVMDGHSTDATASRAREAGAAVHRDPGRGKGSAVRASFPMARGSIVVLMDADGSHAAADVPRLAGPILRGEADLVVGSRFTGGSDELSMTLPQLVRSVGNISMNIAINTRFGVSLTDTLNGFRAIRKSVALNLELREELHTIEQEMVIQALRRGYRVTNVATHEYSRRFGSSSIDIWRQWPRFVWCLMRNIVQQRRFVPRAGAARPCPAGDNDGKR